MVWDRPNSLLLKAGWEDYNPNAGAEEEDPSKLFVCHSEELVFDGKSFKPIWNGSKKGHCPWWQD